MKDEAKLPNDGKVSRVLRREGKSPGLPEQSPKSDWNAIEETSIGKENVANDEAIGDLGKREDDMDVEVGNKNEQVVDNAVTENAVSGNEDDAEFVAEKMVSDSIRGKKCDDSLAVSQILIIT